MQMTARLIALCRSTLDACPSMIIILIYYIYLRYHDVAWLKTNTLPSCCAIDKLWRTVSSSQHELDLSQICHVWRCVMLMAPIRLIRFRLGRFVYVRTAYQWQESLANAKVSARQPYLIFIRLAVIWGIEVIQGHRPWCQSKAQLPIGH